MTVEAKPRSKSAQDQPRLPGFGGGTPGSTEAGGGSGAARSTEAPIAETVTTAQIVEEQKGDDDLQWWQN